ncbi:MAG TPA: hypothetical protein VGR45_08970 [Stellaceae bacterium]|nr:hypothetical protein [Stellaceae bacterium]
MMKLLAALGIISVAFAQGTAPNPPGPVMQSAPYLTTPAYTTQGCQSGVVKCNYQQFTPSAAQGLPNIPQSANYALVLCTTNTVNWTDDGTTAPTSSIGMPLAASIPIIFAERPLSLVQIIQAASTATCNVSYYQ